MQIKPPIATLDILRDRPREVFRRIVEAYLETGQPIGSRTLSQLLPQSVSSATIRNVMADLEAMGLLYAPHTSAGRLPTEAGLRLFVDGLLEIGDIANEERRAIEAEVAGKGRTLEDALTQASTVLSELSRCAGLVFTPKQDVVLKHIEFVQLSPGRALVVLVGADGSVENRVVETPAGLPASALIEATNFLNARVVGRSLDEVRAAIQADIDLSRQELSEVSARVVEAGLAVWAEDTEAATLGRLIVRGHSNLLGDINAIEDLDRVRRLLEDLETKADMLDLVNLAKEGEGVRIFIGSENALFSMSGSSLVVAPYMNGERRVVGAIGVIGPTRLNYARIVPMVDFTAQIVSRIITR